MKNSDRHNIAASVAKLLGHSLAVAIGFVGSSQKTDNKAR